MSEGRATSGGPRDITPSLDPLRDQLRSRLFGTPSVPARIGRFEVLRELGAGAMGRVYAARDDRLDRQVAIKVLQHAHVARAPARQRLMREAQALARLSHPNVVVVHEVGERDDEVFLVMELVDGQTLRQWQTARTRPWREVLLRYVDAGGGLAAAHRAGLVHRDFKPDNVLVGDDGRVRVADFGLVLADADANDSDPDVERSTASGEDPSPPTALEQRLTRTGARLGTPAYMSPEQLGGRPCDARSDQFAFCVALYEALLGRRPFQGSTPTALLAVMLLEQRPKPPSSELPRWLLAAITRGLALEPDRRHPDMETLLDALTRRLGRRRGLGSIAIVGLGLAGALAWPRAEDPCARAGEELDDVWNEDTRAAGRAAFVATELPFAEPAWNDAQSTLDLYAAGWRATQTHACEATHVHHVRSADALDATRMCLEERRRELTALVEAFDEADATVVEHATEAVATLGRVEPCEDLERLRAAVAPPPPEIADTVTAQRYALARARAEHWLGRTARATDLLDPVLDEAEALGYPPLLAEALTLSGQTETRRGAYGRAEATLLRAIDLAEGARYDELAAYAWLKLSDLGTTRLQDPERAARWLRRTRAAVTRIGGPADLDGAAWMLAGHLHMLERRTEDAALAYHAAIEQLQSVREPSHPDVLSARSGLAEVRVANGELDEAEREYDAIIERLEGSLGPHHPRVGEQRFNLALLLSDQGRLDEARHLFERVSHDYEGAFGADSPRLIGALQGLASVEERAGRLDEAQRLTERTLIMLEGSDAPASERFASFTLLGTIQFRRRRWEASLESFRTALGLMEPETSPVARGLASSNVADALLSLGRTAEARAHYEDALAVMTPELPAEHALLAYPLHGMGEVALTEGRADLALEPLRRALKIRRASPGDAAGLASTQWALARALPNSGPEAFDSARAARETFEALGDTANRDEIDAWLDAQLQPSEETP